MAPPGLFRVGRIVPIVTSGISVPSSIRRYQMRLKEHCVANVANFFGIGGTPSGILLPCGSGTLGHWVCRSPEVALKYLPEQGPWKWQKSTRVIPQP